MAEQDNFEKVARAFFDFFGASKFTHGFRVGSANNRRLIQYGAHIRDRDLHRYSILPGAIHTFISIASSREWQILGTPRTATRTLDMLHKSQFTDSEGIIHYGFEELITRMCMDWLCIGRAMFHSEPNIPSERVTGWTPYEYIDVAELQTRVDEAKTYWQYRNPIDRKQRNIEQTEMFFMDSVRIGSTGGVIGPVAWLIPVAHMDWLLREHDSMQLDGRKIRDILVVMEGMKEEFEEAVTISMALSAGQDPSKHGIPVIEINPGGYEAPMQDYFARIGLSEIPREFSRQEFESRYAREISATLGLPIGQFWHDPAGTNRALEQVTQERSTLKGPAYFIRSLERLINNSPTTGTRLDNRSIIQFQEETDNSSLKEKADAMLGIANAIKALEEALGEKEEPQPIVKNPLLNEEGQPEEEQPEEEQEAARQMKSSGTNVIGNKDAWISYLQTQGLLPPNISMSELVIMEEQSLKRSVSEEERDPMDKGWVRLNSDGMVLERRAEFMIPT